MMWLKARKNKSYEERYYIFNVTRMLQRNLHGRLECKVHLFPYSLS